MSFIHVQSIKDVFTKEEKGEIIREITQVFARMKSDEFAAGTWVVVSEIDGGCWGEGGEVLDADHVPDSSSTDTASQGLAAV